MSKKKLSKTYLERGKDRSDSYFAKHSHSESRAKQRDLLVEIIKDPASSDELCFDDVVGSGMGSFKLLSSSNTAPIDRWLESKVGQTWSDVRSEAVEKFGKSTSVPEFTAINYILSKVNDTSSGFDANGYDASGPNYFQGYYVESDILKKRIKTRRKKSENISEDHIRSVENWLQGRMVGEKGGVLYWIVPSSGEWKASWTEEKQWSYHFSNKLGLYYYNYIISEYRELSNVDMSYIDRIGYIWKRIDNPVGFKQRGPLTKTELEDFKCIHSLLVQDILAFGNVRV